MGIRAGAWSSWRKAWPGFAVAAATLAAPTVQGERVAAAAPACDTRIDSPHVSSGAGGVIAKGRYRCYGASQMGVNMRLWRCDTAPPRVEGLLDRYCDLVATASYSGWDPVDGVQYTRYVPRAGERGGQGSGYWVACDHVWVSDGKSANTTVDVSPVVYLSTK